MPPPPSPRRRSRRADGAGAPPPRWATRWPRATSATFRGTIPCPPVLSHARTFALSHWTSMANGWRDLFFGPEPERGGMVESTVPRRTFADVILPPSTRRQLDQALAQIGKHEVLFGDWGLGER